MKQPLIGVLWLRPSDYQRACALSEDGLPLTYEAWRDKIEKVIAGLPVGVTVVRIEADPDEVADWCRRNGHKVDSKGRSAFAAWAAVHRKLQN